MPRTLLTRLQPLDVNAPPAVAPQFPVLDQLFKVIEEQLALVQPLITPVPPATVPPFLQDLQAWAAQVVTLPPTGPKDQAFEDLGTKCTKESRLITKAFFHLRALFARVAVENLLTDDDIPYQTKAMGLYQQFINIKMGVARKVLFVILRGLELRCDRKTDNNPNYINEDLDFPTMPYEMKTATDLFVHSLFGVKYYICIRKENGKGKICFYDNDVQKWAWLNQTGLPNAGNCYAYSFTQPDNIVWASADDVDLIVLDESGTLYYAQMFFGPKQTTWQGAWGQVPFAFPMWLPFTQNSGKWPVMSISHRPDPVGWNDISGVIHQRNTTTPAEQEPLVGGTTTLFKLDDSGKKIKFTDPWQGGDFDDGEFNSPNNGSVVLTNMVVSSGTLFAIDETGNMYTTVTDFDMNGQNLDLTYHYEDEKGLIHMPKYYWQDAGSTEAPEVALPAFGWTQQPPIQYGNFTITSQITIVTTYDVQKENPNDRRELRVAGTKKLSDPAKPNENLWQPGYFSKQIDASVWDWNPDKSKLPVTPKPAGLPISTPAKVGPSMTRSFHSTKMEYTNKYNSVLTSKLEFTPLEQVHPLVLQLSTDGFSLKHFNGTLYTRVVQEKEGGKQVYYGKVVMQDELFLSQSEEVVDMALRLFAYYKQWDVVVTLDSDNNLSVLSLSENLMKGPAPVPTGPRFEIDWTYALDDVSGWKAAIHSVHGTISQHENAIAQQIQTLMQYTNEILQRLPPKTEEKVSGHKIL